MIAYFDKNKDRHKIDNENYIKIFQNINHKFDIMNEKLLQAKQEVECLTGALICLILLMLLYLTFTIIFVIIKPYFI
jgi:hypothetical protein